MKNAAEIIAISAETELYDLHHPWGYVRTVIQSFQRPCRLLMVGAESPRSFPLRNLHCLIWISAGLLEKAVLFTQVCG